MFSCSASVPAMFSSVVLDLFQKGVFFFLFLFLFLFLFFFVVVLIIIILLLFKKILKVVELLGLISCITAMLRVHLGKYYVDKCITRNKENYLHWLFESRMVYWLIKWALALINLIIQGQYPISLKSNQLNDTNMKNAVSIVEWWQAICHLPIKY